MKMTSTKVGGRVWRNKTHSVEFCGSSKGTIGTAKDFAVHAIIDGRSVMITFTESEAKTIIEHWTN